MKKLTYLVSLLLFLFGCALMHENAFQRDLDAFDNLPPHSLLQGTYSGSFSAAAMLEKGSQTFGSTPGPVVTARGKQLRKVAVFPAKGIITWIDKDGKERRLKVTQGRSHMIHEYGQTVLWLGDSAERGFYLLDLDPTSDGTRYKGRLLKGGPIQVQFGFQ